MTGKDESPHFLSKLRRSWPLLLVLAAFGAWWWSTGGYDFRQKRIAGAEHAARGPVVVLGDELVLGAGASSEERGFARLLKDRLKRDVIVVASPGEATVTAEQKLLPEVLAKKPGLVVVQLGLADLDQRLALGQTTEALRKIFAAIQQSGAMVVFVGAALPDVGDNWMMALEHLCKEMHVLFIPDVLKELSRDKAALDATGKLPTDQGHAMIAERIAASLRPYL